VDRGEGGLGRGIGCDEEEGGEQGLLEQVLLLEEGVRQQGQVELLPLVELVVRLPEAALVALPQQAEPVALFPPASVVLAALFPPVSVVLAAPLPPVSVVLAAPLPPVVLESALLSERAVEAEQVDKSAEAVVLAAPAVQLPPVSVE